MSSDEAPKIEPTEADKQTAGTGEKIISDHPPTAEVSGNAYVDLPRRLSGPELKQSGVIKMLLEEIARLNRENAILDTLRDNYQIVSIKAAVFEEKLKKDNKFNILYPSALVVGGALIGVIPTQTNGYIILTLIVLAAILFGVSLFLGFSKKF